MGKIKSKLVKRTGDKLIVEGIPFTSKFDDNKKILGRTMPSKKLRNQIAGYVTRVKTLESRKAAMPTSLSTRSE